MAILNTYSKQYRLPRACKARADFKTESETERMSKASLRAAIEAGEFVVAPGVPDMIAGLVSNKVGFDFVYASGYWLTASAHGLPDAGLATYTQMRDRVATLARTVNAGVIADADTGYGGLLNVHHTVRGYEEAGAVAVQIEDQEFPKKCGHTPFKRVIPVQDMAEKIRVACEARRDPRETLIIARTDARQPEGFESAVRRGIAYGEAGADIIFVEALESEQELKQVCTRISKPLLANMAAGGITPILPVDELRRLGFCMAIFPGLASLAAAAAVETILTRLKQSGTAHQPDVPLFDFDTFNRLIGFPAVWDLDEKWARRRDASVER